jgi:hypothetical protein
MAEAGEHPRQQRRKPRIFRLDSTPAGVITRAKQTQLSPFLGQKWGVSEKTNPILRRRSSVGVGFSPGARRPGCWGADLRPEIAAATIQGRSMPTDGA